MIVHNMYLTILAEQGLIGMTVYVIFILVIFRQAFNLYRNSTTKIGRGIGLGFSTCMITHLVGSISGDVSQYYNLMAIYWIFLGIVARFQQ